MIEPARERGAALIIVIWALAIIGAVVAAFFTRGILEAKYARDGRAEAAGRALAQAGVACFLQRFLADETEADVPDEPWLMAGEHVPPAFPGGEVTVTVSDLGSRINLNLADEALLRALFDGEAAPAQAVMDWRDADHQPRPSGAEDDYYSGLSPPLKPADGFILSPAELPSIKGLAEFKEVLDEDATIYGRANPNFIDAETWGRILVSAGCAEWEVEPLTRPFLEARQRAVREKRVAFRQADDLVTGSITEDLLQRLRPYLTFTGTINPNLASERTLASGLAMLGLKREYAKIVLETRKKAPFVEMPAFLAILAANEPNGINNDMVKQVFTLQTTLVGVEAVGRTAAGICYRIHAVYERYRPPGKEDEWRGRVIAWRESPGEG